MDKETIKGMGAPCYKGLWEDDPQEGKSTFYQVVELYDWDRDIPTFNSYTFQDGGLAEDFFRKRVREIADEVFDEPDIEWRGIDLTFEYLRIFREGKPCESCEDSICMTNESDYVRLYLFKNTFKTDLVS